MIKANFRKLNDWLWEIPESFRPDMRVPARIYVSERMFGEVEEEALIQAVNVAVLPGICQYSLAMPDIHSGYGFPIGGVAATEFPAGFISPGGIGFDQNCGCRLLLSDCSELEVKSHLEKLAAEIQKQVPSGLGRAGWVKLSNQEMEAVLESGVKYLLEKGYGQEGDRENCEALGSLPEAEASSVSRQAKDRGKDQLGTLGSGNHFIEVQKVEKIFEPEVARVFGLFEEQIVVFIHTGSRGLGHQNCTDYLKTMLQVMPKYKISLPDRQLAGVPFNSPEGQSFFRAMSAGANFAWANRQLITHFVRKAWQAVLNRGELKLLYDVAHNIAKVETHNIDGQPKKLIVHRKGATRAFPAGSLEIPKKYRAFGQPVLIPGSMGTASYILVGIESSRETFYSTCHGAGRVMSRHESVRRVSGQNLAQELDSKGVIVKCHSLRGLAEEAPSAYKDIDQVVEVVQAAGLSRKVARLKPLAVVKGE